IFLGIVSICVWLDLRLHRKDTEISLANATIWSVFWVVLALIFYFYLRQRFGAEYASLFLSGYILERSLSIDNLMVFMAIFASFGIKGALQHRVLYLGIVGAVVFRLLFVAFGTGLLGLSTWMEFLFAAIVLWTGIQMLQSGDNEEIEDYSEHWSVRLTKRLLPIFPRLYRSRFLLKQQEYETLQRQGETLSPSWQAPYYATPLLLCLICIEVSDIVFSFDSVPAVIAVTREPLLIYTSIIFAILGLRSMYFMLLVAAKYLYYLGTAVALLLFFIAAKLTIQASNELFDWPGIYIDPNTSLWIILGTLTLGVLTSLVFPGKESVTVAPQSNREKT
ncbi:MAG TPA: TerC/Alx family metal homeostasis membrane protein, partial [Saprospiraceae bacterium]|nr:TerC/Alx family metal homeostasis membrane protein [Saprospiraceae bacterium]